MKRNFLSVVGLIALCCTTMWGQGFTASVFGTVSDNTGAVMSGVTVTISNSATGQQTVAQTDAAGTYQASLLPPGKYRVTAEVTGFKRSVVDPVTLQVDQRERLDFQLELGAVSENVTVTAEAGVIQAETATVGTAVTSAQTSELPLNGRNFLQLNLLVPGAQGAVKGSTLQTQGGGIEVHGLRENSNYFWIDGIDNTGQAIGQYVVNPPQYTIQEFRVMSPTYDAEFGRTAGAQINVITRSGGNTWHGDGYEFLRNSWFDAKNFFDPPGKAPAFRRNQFGADAGGRLVKDRSFLFMAWDGLRYAQGESASALVPPTAYIQGNFSGLSTQLKDPLTGANFAGNIIPRSRMNDIGVNMASYYPAPNSGTNTLLSSPIGNNTDDVTMAKFDQVLTSKDRLSAHVAFETISYVNPIAQYNNNTNIPGFGLINDGGHNYTTGVNETHVFSPSLVSEVRAGWNRWTLRYIQQDRDKDYVTLLGLKGIATRPRDYGFPNVSLSGLYASLGAGTSIPQDGPFDTTFIAPTFTWVHGKHNLKFGGDWHRFQSNYFQDGNIRGTFNFTGAFTGNALADLLLGVPASATVASVLNFDTQFLFVSKQVSGFVQDDWHVSPHLTLTFGMRYEYTFPTYEKQNRMANFNTATGQLIQAGVNGNPNNLYNADPKEFAPRFGFVWSPSQKWAVRGGYGLFYELSTIAQFLGMRQNPPFFTTKSVTGDGKTITLSNVFDNATGVAFPALSGFAQDFHAGRVQQFSIGTQRELLPGLVLDIGYVGNRGDRLYGTVNVNQPTPAAGTIQTRRPYPQFANINITQPVFSSQYDGLEVRMEKRLSKGVHFLASYTFSHAYDNSSGSGGTNTAQNARNINAEWGPSSYDVTHHFAFSYVYELPFGRNRMFLNSMNKVADTIIGGWQLNGILNLHTGQPFTPIWPTDISNTGQNSERPNLIGDPFASTPTCQTKTPNCWANAAAFAAAAQYTFGNAGRNEVRGPGFQQLDFALAKKFYITEQMRVDFRAEAFNLFNHPNFNNPSATLNASFGRILTAEAPRQLQFGLRFVF